MAWNSTIKQNTGKCPDCVADGNNNDKPLIGKHPPRCQYHHRLAKQKDKPQNKRKPRPDKKNGSNRENATSIKKISQKGRETIDKDNEVYLLLWATRDHICEECGCNLGNEPRRYYFSHILPKGAHPNARHLLTNFNILCLEDHQKHEFGDRKSMRIFAKNEKLIPKIIREEKAKSIIAEVEYFQDGQGNNIVTKANWKP